MVPNSVSRMVQPRPQHVPCGVSGRDGPNPREAGIRQKTVKIWWSDAILYEAQELHYY